MDRFLIQIRGLFCGQTLTTFCGQTLSTDSWTFLWTDFSVDRLLLLLVDGLFLQIRGLFCGQTFLWTDSCYFSVDRLLLLFVDRLLLQIRGLFCGQTCWSCWQNCGQILVINSGQILWTNLCTFVWQILVTDSIDKNTNLDIEILLTEFVDKFVQPWQTFFRRACWKEYQRFSFQQGGEICFLWDKL